MPQEDEGCGQQDQHERVVIWGNLQWPDLVCGHSGERLHGGGGFSWTSEDCGNKVVFVCYCCLTNDHNLCGLKTRHDVADFSAQILRKLAATWWPSVFSAAPLPGSFRWSTELWWWDCGFCMLCWLSTRSHAHILGPCPRGPSIFKASDWVSLTSMPLALWICVSRKIPDCFKG